MIPQANISRLSNRLAGQDGRRIPENILELNYCAAWFLTALSRMPLGRRLVFKGGTALKQCYYGDYRFSEDLDFTLIAETSFEAIQKELEAVYQEVKNDSGIIFRFKESDRKIHPNSHTFYLEYEGPIPRAAKLPQIKVDITIKEKLVFKPVHKPVLRPNAEFSDLPGDSQVQVYSLEEIMTEKLVALMDRARTEPRDLYDVWHLIGEGSVDLEQLKNPVEEKLAFRGKTLAGVTGEFSSKKERYEKLWENRLVAQMLELPEFEGVFRSVQRELKKILPE
jgi:predicted nucleotidyltransferase component of viral defense system